MQDGQGYRSPAYQDTTNHVPWVFFLGKEIRCDSIKVNRQDNSYILGSHFARIVKIAGKFDSIPSKAREAPFHTGIFRGVLTQTP